MEPIQCDQCGETGGTMFRWRNYRRGRPAAYWCEACKRKLDDDPPADTPEKVLTTEDRK